jgi:hypothetical protein
VKLEEYFSTTGEKAHCLSWIHKQAETLYSSRRTWIDLPVIVGSGVIAFLNAASSSLFDDPKISSVALGVGSLIVGIMNTMGSYFGWSRRAEGHRISAIHYSKLYRFITVELSLPREERMKPQDFLKYVKDQYDRLQEISPIIPTIIINDFQKKFAKETEISKPEEANGLEKITVYRRSDEEEDPGRPSTVLKTGSGKTATPKGVFTRKNPLFTPKKSGNGSDSEEEKQYVPTLKALEEASQSVKLPEAPAELTLPPKVEVSSS